MYRKSKSYQNNKDLFFFLEDWPETPGEVDLNLDWENEPCLATKFMADQLLMEKREEEGEENEQR